MNCICKKFFSIAEKYPDHCAVLDKNRTVTYEELKNEVMRWAVWIDSKNSSTGTPLVGVMVNHSVEQIAAILGILCAGCGYIPMEPDFPCKRVDTMLREAKVKTVITERQYASCFGTEINTLFIEDFACQETGTDISQINGERQNIAYVLFTSGSTGTPKGVMVSYQNLLHYTEAFQNEFHLQPEDRVLQMSVINFDIFVEEVFPALLHGSSICILDQAIKNDTEAIVAFCNNNGVTIISAFPYFLQELNTMKIVPGFVRVLISGGDTLFWSYINYLIQYVDIYNTYGPTETTVCASYYHCRKGSYLGKKNIPIGFPIKDVQIKIIDEQGRLTRARQTGEICIAGKGVSLGYLNRPEETARSFVYDDLTNERWYLSGDMGYYNEEGEIVFLHRKDNQVMIGGKRVECMEVENVISHSALVEYVVVKISYDVKGFPHIIAHLQLKDKKCLSELQRYISGYLLDYMIPEHYCVYDSFPMTLNGKIDRSALDFQFPNKADI